MKYWMMKNFNRLRKLRLSVSFHYYCFKTLSNSMKTILCPILSSLTLKDRDILKKKGKTVNQNEKRERIKKKSLISISEGKKEIKSKSGISEEECRL